MLEQRTSFDDSLLEQEEQDDGEYDAAGEEGSDDGSGEVAPSARRAPVDAHAQQEQPQQESAALHLLIRLICSRNSARV